MITATKILIHNPDKLEQRLQEIPPEPGVYFMRDDTDRILYIGKSKKLRSRVRSARQDCINSHNYISRGHC